MGSDRRSRASKPRSRYFNPRSPGGERHAGIWYTAQTSDFNPRSPGGERLIDNTNTEHKDQFQSTLPGWGATLADNPQTVRELNFNPRSPGGERLCDDRLLQAGQGFQSTLPGWGATRARSGTWKGSRNFNPRSPGGERPLTVAVSLLSFLISIHAPRVGSDRENGHLRPRYGQNHPFSTLIVSQIVVDVLGTVRKSQKHQRTSHYEVIKQPERRK